MASMMTTPAAADGVASVTGGGGGGDAAGHASFSGQLSKFTNVVKGWQPRWFTLESGRLDYYLTDERGGRKRRGGSSLDGALVLPSDEDSQTFTVQFAAGDTFKLRAANVRERQVWVDRVREAAQRATASSPARESAASVVGTVVASGVAANGQPSQRLQHLNLSVPDAFGSVQDMLRQAEVKNDELSAAIESLPPPPPRPSGSGARADLLKNATNDQRDSNGPYCLDTDLLVLKATSYSALLALEQAMTILQDIRDARLATPVVAATPAAAPSSVGSQARAFFAAALPTSSPKRGSTAVLDSPSRSSGVGGLHPKIGQATSVASTSSTLSLPADLRANPPQPPS